MTTLTIYTENFDDDERIVNGGKGMSGKVFLDIDNQFGKQCTTLDEALEYSSKNNIPIDQIEFDYLSTDGIQMFKKFKVVQ